MSTPTTNMTQRALSWLAPVVVFGALVIIMGLVMWPLVGGVVMNLPKGVGK